MIYKDTPHGDWPATTVKYDPIITKSDTSQAWLSLLFLRVGPIQLSQMRATDPNNVELLPAGGIITVALFLGSSQ